MAIECEVLLSTSITSRAATEHWSFMHLSDFGRRADDIITLGNVALDTSGRTEYGGNHLDEGAFMEFRTAALSFLKSVFGSQHPYYETFAKDVTTSVKYSAHAGLGIVAAAKTEILGGWTQTATGIVSAEIFADFLEIRSQ